MRRLSLLLVAALAPLTACGDFLLTREFPSGGGSPDPDDDRVIIVNGGESDDAGVAPDTGGAPPPPQPDAGPGSPDLLDDPDTMPSPPPGSCGDAWETEVFNIVNQERAQRGLPAYECDQIAVQVAHAYSKYMCDAGFFSHYGPDGSSPSSRLRDGGADFSGAGENIAAGQGSPQEVMQTWMNSPGHRANILGDYSHIGVGYYQCGSGYGHYWTQSFMFK